MAISIADYSCSPTRPLGLFTGPEKTHRMKQSMWHRLGFRKWLGRDDRDSPQSPPAGSNLDSDDNNHNRAKPHTNLTRRLSRRVGVGLPRPATFKRQNSERRDRLTPYEPEPRAVSADRRRTLSIQRSRSPQPNVGHRLSAPEVQWFDKAVDTTVEEPPEANDGSEIHSEWNPYPEDTDGPEKPPEDVIEWELEKKWILNLSMHFRDRSQREKFFITYAETPNRWRRVTISCDYRNTGPDSLEQDLKELRYQRDKYARIYESLRDSLPEIQFYDTVTNLKLETRDGRLHVHVTEDVNEIIPYPPISCVGHLHGARFIPENELHFDAHLSGFVYNVRLGDKVFIKKEIPGPDTVDEFLYEINALHALIGSQYVIQVEGIVVDDRRELVKGLLISYAEQGALVDILYEQRSEIPWRRRERWAEQIIHGLCDIHESGYVQGDFTLSNIVVDADNNAKIIDINRRGCPVGWEPPEIAAKIESNQRISMYIGVKTDLFQLGMTLWALAMEDDEPERQDRPLILHEDVKVPDYYRKLVAICMSPTPRHRLSAKELLSFFPKDSVPSYHLPSPYRTVGRALKLDNSMLTPQSVPSVPASLPNCGFADRLSSPHLGSSDLDGKFSLNQYEPNFAPAPPYVEGYSHTSLLDGETNAGVAEIADLTGGSETNGILPGDNQLVQPHPDSPSERSFRNHPDSSQNSEVVECSREPKRAGGREGIGFEENGVDLAANLHPLDKVSIANLKQHLPPLSMHDTPKDATEVGINTANPSEHAYTRQPEPVQYHESPVSSTATQSADLYPTPVAGPGPACASDAKPTYVHSPAQAQSHSATSLFHSLLPINPALEMSKREPAPTSTHQLLSHSTVHSTIDHLPQEVREHIARLCDSKLPINPAFTGDSPPPL